MGIGLVKMACKVCKAVVNCRLKRGIVLNDALHGFRVERFIVEQGTGTATLEANLDQHLDGLAHKPLFQLSLDIRKEYDSLDRGEYI